MTGCLTGAPLQFDGIDDYLVVPMLTQGTRAVGMWLYVAAQQPTAPTYLLDARNPSLLATGNNPEVRERERERQRRKNRES